MNQMRTGILLAVVLGILLGSGLAYTSSTQTNAPTARPELLYQPTAQGGTSLASTPSSPNIAQTIIPLLIGLLFAVPVFLVAKRRAK
jgi:ABC-type antimicrobial peptide transport system permease subunit